MVKRWRTLSALLFALVLCACETVKETNREQLILPLFTDDVMNSLGVDAYAEATAPYKVIAGTRDEGLRQAAEMLASREALDALQKEAGQRADFEALYEVSGMDRVNIGGRLLVASPLDANVIWGTAEAAPTKAPAR